MNAASAHDALGIPGFTFSDLHQPARLAALHECFSDEVRRLEPDLWAQWEAHRTTPEALGPVARSNLIVALASHVSRFVTRLFGVGPDADAMAAHTRVYDELFRFKIDFVRRRALPLLKGGAVVRATEEDHSAVDRLWDSVSDLDARELVLARAGCRLLDRESAARERGDEADRAAVASDIESLKRWCAAHVHDPRFRQWVVFRFPESLDAEHLVRVRRPDHGFPEAMVGPEDRRRRRQGFTLTDARFGTREVLSEIHYCVLCHEREKDTCSTG
ncbi:MAG: hypothetical protein ACT4QD_23960, partial [Acidobacteriota bacterium]